MRCTLICLLLFSACARGPANAQPAVAAQPVRPPGIEAYGAVKVVRDVEFAQPGGAALKLDVYIPQPLPQGRRLPVVIYFHGGGWRSKDKRGGSAYLDALARSGFIGLSADYRLSPQAKFPAQLDDAREAVAWARAHAAEYGGDGARLGVCGTSAGGHLAALLGTTGAEVKAVADWYGPADLRRSDLWPKASRGMIGQLLGGTPEELPQLAQTASPTAFVSPDDPSFLIIHGAKDTTVPVAQSTALRAALESAGVSVQYVEVKDGGHGQFGRAKTGELIETMAQFFHAKL